MKQIQAPKTFTRGLAFGPVFLLQKQAFVPSEEPSQGVAEEQARYDEALGKVATDLMLLAEDNPIFMGHFAISQDPMLQDAVKRNLNLGKNAEQAVATATDELREMFRSLDDAYLKEREDDVRDIGERILAALQGRSIDPFAALDEPSVIVARDLLPSDTAKLPRDLVLGFITEEGGVTSHVAIMSKSLGLPALVGVPGILDAAKAAEVLAFDAATGEIIFDPDAEVAKAFEAKQQAFEEQEKRLAEAAKKPATTEDGRTVKVYANLGSLDDLELAQPYEPDGVGLFRSEFLFMNSNNWPGEDEQYSVYKKALQGLDGGELILRTLDIGGDKDLPYYDFPAEENPFLGWRAVRFCLARTDIFKTQLRAALRASAHGELRIMYPMIVSVAEVNKCKALLEECKEELKAEGKDFNPDVPQGIMVETPAAFIMGEELAKEVDFFSIGTNDLTQYVLAADRGNAALKDLYDTLNPAVLRAIKMTIDRGHSAGIEVGMCGEFAGRADVTELLLGMGLDEFSMAAPDMALIKDNVQHLNYEEAKKFADEILQLDSAEAVAQALEERQA